jgi:hypothetical protein
MAAAETRDKVLCVDSGPILRAFAPVLNLAVHDASSRTAEPAGDLEETLARLGIVPDSRTGPRSRLFPAASLSR